MTFALPTDLRTSVLAIAGIADAAVEQRDGTPVVRVWLDGSRDERTVAADIRELLTEPRPGSTRPVVDSSSGRRSGLGKGLAALIPSTESASRSEDESGPRLLRSAPEPIRLDAVAVVERADGVVVRAVDTATRSAEAPALLGDLDMAVSVAVSGLLDAEPPSSVSLDVRDLGGQSVATVVLGFPDGVSKVGSAVVRAGMPFTVGMAVWAAFHDGDGPDF